MQKHPPDVQRRVLAQILDYISGKPTSSPQIRTWGDKLKVKLLSRSTRSWLMESVVIRVSKRLGSSDPRELLNVVVNRLKAQWAARSQTSQSQHRTQAEPPPQPQRIPEPLPVAQSQFQTTHSDYPPQPKIITERPVSSKLHRPTREALKYIPRPMAPHLYRRRKS